MHGTVQISVDTAPQHTLETSDSHSLVVLISKAYKANLSTEISSVDCDDRSTGLSDDTMRLSDDRLSRTRLDRLFHQRRP